MRERKGFGLEEHASARAKFCAELIAMFDPRIAIVSDDRVARVE